MTFKDVEERYLSFSGKEQREETICVLIKTFCVFVAKIDDELDDRYALQKI